MRVQGNPRHPATRGLICRKFSLSPPRVYDPQRLVHPMRRSGPKGSGRFQKISWPEAVDRIVTRWKRILSEQGPYSILPFYGSGTEGLINGQLSGKRFFNRLGTLQLDRTICTKAGRLGFRYTLGTSAGADPCAVSKAKMVIAWGVNAPSTHLHFQSLLSRARRNGTKYVIVNPFRVRDSHRADRVLQPLPGTDAALALGMMHVLIEEKLHDAGYVRECAVGFEELRQRARQYPPEKVEAITGIKADAVRDFARLYASERPTLIFLGPGCQRHTNGGMTVRTIACLPALVGDWSHAGGGVYYPTHTIFPVDWTPLEGEDLRPNPPVSYNMIHLGRALARPVPPIKSLYVFNGNPAGVLYHQGPLRAQLEREDLFTVVHEIFMTDTARYADILLPATTIFEYADLFCSYFHVGLLLNQPAIDPLGECRSNLDTFRSLAGALDFKEPCFQKDAEEVLQEILGLGDPLLQGVTLERLKEEGFIPLRPGPLETPFKEGAFPTPSGKIELYSRQLASEGKDPLPCYVPLKEGPEAAPELFKRYPLYLLTPAGHPFLNTNFGKDGDPAHPEERPTVVIHPADAGRRGIREGMWVEVSNDRGACLLQARVSGDIRPGVMMAAGRWWDRYYRRGENANHTTPDFTADMGGGSAFNTNLVDARPFPEGAE